MVRLSNQADEFVITDAVRVERLMPAPIQVRDDGEPGFRRTAGFTPFSGQGFGNDVTYAAPGSGGEVAEWTFAVTPGTYRISATWTPHANRATNAPFTILNGSVPLATVSVNQQLAPNDFSDYGVMWENLGTFTVAAADTLTVRLTDLANGFVIADGIRIERVG